MSDTPTDESQHRKNVAHAEQLIEPLESLIHQCLVNHTVGVLDELQEQFATRRDAIAQLKKELTVAQARISELESERDALQWLIENGEKMFGTLWREASAKDIDAARGKDATTSQASNPEPHQP